MMPQRVVTVRLWNVAAAFLLVLAVFVASLGLQQRQARHDLKARDKVRADLVRQIQADQRGACHDRHVLHDVLAGAIRQGVQSARKSLRGPLGQVPGARATLLDAIVNSQRLLVQLRSADCRGITPLLP